MPNYVKFMKDMLTKKRRFGEFETVALTRECSAVLQNKLPPKLKDLGSFTIPCSIGNQYFGKALCDLGASINLMPMSIFKKLGIGEARPTTVSLQLADRSIAHPKGKIEDVLVKVDKFIFPVDFIVLNYEADLEVPIILGRPFLATGRTLINVQKGELTMRVQDEHVTFNVFQSMKFPSDMEECSVISLADSLVAEQLERCASLKKKWNPSCSNVMLPHMEAILGEFELRIKSYKQVSTGQHYLEMPMFLQCSIAQIYPFGAVELEDEKSGRKFKVNGQRIKHYFGGEVDRQQEAMPLHDG
ncbi:hypothetical protein UlMin_023815 [Ulmus minor]